MISFPRFVILLKPWTPPEVPIRIAPMELYFKFESNKRRPKFF